MRIKLLLHARHPQSRGATPSESLAARVLEEHEVVEGPDARGLAAGCRQALEVDTEGRVAQYGGRVSRSTCFIRSQNQLNHAHFARFTATSCVNG